MKKSFSEGLEKLYPDVLSELSCRKAQEAVIMVLVRTKCMNMMVKLKIKQGCIVQ